jgi:hypothetical protein
MKQHQFSYVALFPVIALFFFISCDWFDLDELIEPDPTKSRMEGVWEVTEAYNEDGESILDEISFPITALSLTNDNSVISTAGPMITYIVYGGNKYNEVASKIDQVFNYTKLSTNNGEWTIEGGVVDRFTIEMKLQGLPGQHSLTELLGWFGIGADYFDEVIYHKFIDVKVTFEDFNDTVMTWEFDNQTEARYNIKDKKTLNYVLWEGISTDSFEKCTFVLTKRVKDLEDLIRDAA